MTVTVSIGATVPSSFRMILISPVPMVAAPTGWAGVAGALLDGALLDGVLLDGVLLDGVLCVV